VVIDACDNFLFAWSEVVRCGEELFELIDLSPQFWSENADERKGVHSRRISQKLFIADLRSPTLRREGGNGVRQVANSDKVCVCTTRCRGSRRAQTADRVLASPLRGRLGIVERQQILSKHGHVVALRQYGCQRREIFGSQQCASGIDHFRRLV